MTVRKRTATRSRYEPADFLVSDGWLHSDLDAVPLLGSVAVAQAAWERCRVPAWELSLDQEVGRLR